MQIVCGTLLVLSPLIALFLIYNTLQRIRESGSLVMREEYQFLENGNLRGPGLLFDVEKRMLSLKNQTIIPFDDIRGVFLEILPGRRVGVGILTSSGENRLLSMVTNNDINVAARDAGMIAEVVAGQGEKFAQAAKNHVWTQVQVGTGFEFRF